jgi:predicted HTH domain antitoxin
VAYTVTAMSTTIWLELPEEIARQLESKWKDLRRAALESLAVEAYRSELVSAEQVRCLLGFATRFEVEEFLKQHSVYDYTLQDLEHDRQALRNLQERG